MLNNKNFYPTPKNLIAKMISKVKNKNPEYILEPSAGKGDIIEYIKSNHYCLGYGRHEIKAIEKDDNLFATLKGKDIEVIERDFLEYNGGDVFDLILMNPPFSNGCEHLLKAIDILYSGEIVCLLNAETLKNPYTQSRQILVEKLKELNADIEYIENAFVDAERKTNVETALVHIQVIRDIEVDLLGSAKDVIDDKEEILKDNEDANIALNDSIGALELQYNMVKERGREAIINFYKSGCLSDIIELKVDDVSSKSSGTIQVIMQKQINKFYRRLRKQFWNKALNLPVIKEKMTSANTKKFNAELSESSHLEFTANNVRDFVLSLIGSYEQTLIDACVEMFDDLTHKYSYWSETESNSIKFETWKTNEAFKLGKKVIIPMGGKDAFVSWTGNWDLRWGSEGKMNDIDKVANYFVGKKDYTSISDAIKNHMKLLNIGEETSTKCESTFFKIKFFKKGTLHLEFKDLDLLRKFNIVSCMGKGWLPDDYGRKKYKDMKNNDKSVVDSFEGEKTYSKNVSEAPLFAQNNNALMIELK